MRWLTWLKTPEALKQNLLFGAGARQAFQVISKIASASGKNDNETIYLEQYKVSIDNLYLSTTVEEGFFWYEFDHMGVNSHWLGSPAAVT